MRMHWPETCLTGAINYPYNITNKGEIMLKTIYFVILSLFAISCAPVQTIPQAQLDETLPLCYSDIDCEAKWAAARRWVQENAGYKIQIYSDDLIETYNSTNSALSASVTKNLIANNIYSIHLKVWCGEDLFGCRPTLESAILHFNDYITNSGVSDKNCYFDMYYNHNASKPKLGINIRDVNNKLIIKNICSGSPASNADIKINDVIKKVNGINVLNLDELSFQLNKIDFGDDFSISVLRNGYYYDYYLTMPTEKEVKELIASKQKPENQQSVSNKTTEERLTELLSLLDKKLITKEEFDKKKNEIINEM